MKRITIMITVEEDYAYSGKYRKVRSAMISAAVAKAVDEDLTILAINAKLGTPRKAQNA